MLYQTLARWLEVLRAKVGIAPCLWGLGLAYSHVDQLYPLAAGGYSENLLLSDIVSAIVFAATALASRRFISLGRSSFLLAVAPICSMLGIALLFFSSMLGVALFGSALMAVGFTLLYLLWLELYGCLVPRQVAIAVAGSCILHGVFQGFMNALASPAAVIFALALPVASVLMYVRASQDLASVEWPAKAPASGFAPFALILIWVALFGAITGLGRDGSGAVGEGMLALVGHGLAAVVLFLGAVTFVERFDFKVLYRTAAPVMVVGVAMVVFGGSTSEAGAFLVGMGSEACTLTMVVIGCGIAYMTRSSGMFWAGALIAVECAGFVAGTMTRRVAPSSEVALALAAALALAFLIATVVLFRRDSLLSRNAALGRILDLRPSQAMDVQGFVEQATASSGLSPAEASVLALLAQGAARSEISERLFIAPVTVRVHLSHLCKKMGFSSPSELEEYVGNRCLR